jgi:fructose-1,6-bisphosphatase/inositol monophosphatase family enzyme
LVKEAGGIVTNLEGQNLHPLSGGIVAANCSLHKELIPILQAESRDA